LNGGGAKQYEWVAVIGRTRDGDAVT